MQIKTVPTIPSIEDYLPGEVLVELDRFTEPSSIAKEILEDDSRFGVPVFSLTMLTPEAAAEATDFSYDIGLTGPDSALGGLVVPLINTGSFDTVAWAYSTGTVTGSVPETLGFSSAVFDWDDGGSSDSGIAIFGGVLANGQMDNRLWTGRYGGLDQDSTPFIYWEDATPVGALPPARYGASMIYDALGNRLLLIGGKTGSPALRVGNLP